MVKKLRIHKGGRPKQNRPDKDLGTPEAIARRAMLAKGGDPTMTTCPLDVMLVQGIISREAHTAAVHFRSCRQIVFGSPHPQAVDLNQVSGSGSDYDEQRAESEYRDACTILRATSRRLFDIIHNLVIYERFPKWLDGKYGGDTWDKQRTGHAFATLLAWYMGRQRRAA